MANKLVAHMGLPQSIANVFAARGVVTAKDALSLTEFELMELMDVGLDQVASAVAHISEIACPPYKTALIVMEDKLCNESSSRHLSTGLRGLDDALCGGIPSGVLTELVGPAGIGKTQFCLKLCLQAVMPFCHGGLNGQVVYIDSEAQFSSRRLMEIGVHSFPEVFQLKDKLQEMAGRIIVLRPTSLSEFTESLQQIKLSVLQQQVKLLIIDSISAISSMEGEKDRNERGNHLLGWHISFLKSLAEFSRIPVVVTNQVRACSSREAFCYPFEAQKENSKMTNSHLTAALSFHWAHAVTIRLVLEAHSGQRFIKVAKSPISPPLVFPFVITTSGVILLNERGTEVMGPEISVICSHVHSGLDFM